MGRESEKLLAALQELASRQCSAAVATLVDAWGSTYRRPGARVVIGDDGTLVGSISGGCLEGDIAEIGRTVMRSRRPLVVRYDLAEDELWGLGLGCGGGVDVLIESVYPRSSASDGPTSDGPTSDGPTGDEPSKGSGDREEARAFLTASLAGPQADRSGVLATVISPLGGGEPQGLGRQAALELSSLPRLFWEEGTAAPRFDGEWDEASREWAVQESHRRLADPVARSGVAKGPDPARLRVFFDLFRPARKLLLLGAGHDALPVARLAAFAGFRVVVADPRPAFATAERFPDADEVLVCEPQETPNRVALGERDYVVVMHHHKQRDREALRSWLDGPPRYLGMLGPRRRTQELLDDLEIKEWPERLFAPIGLDLGSETPEQIALSIVSELLAHQNQRDGGPLRERPGSIH